MTQEFRSIGLVDASKDRAGQRYTDAGVYDDASWSTPQDSEEAISRRGAAPVVGSANPRSMPVVGSTSGGIGLRWMFSVSTSDALRKDRRDTGRHNGLAR